MLSQLVKQVGIGLIGQAVFTGAGNVAGIKIGVLQVQVSGSCFVEKLGVILHRFIHAGDVKVLSFLGRNFKVKRFEWSYLGHES